MIEDLTILDIAGALVALVLMWAMLKWSRFLDAQTEDILWARTVGRFRAILMSFVRELDQTEVRPRKKARATNGGGRSLLTEREKQRYATTIVDRLRGRLGPEELGAIARAFEVDPRSQEQVDAFLREQVEAAVHMLKTERAPYVFVDATSFMEGEAEGPFEGAYAPR